MPSPRNRLIGKINLNRGTLYRLSWSPDSQRLAVSCGIDSVYILDGQGQTGLREQSSASAWGLCWSPDGRRIASGNTPDFTIWDADSGERLIQCEGYAGTNVWGVSWSPGGERLACGSADNTMSIWDATTGRQLHLCQGHTHWVQSVAWSPDGLRLATASTDKTVRLWNADTGRETAICQGHERDVRDVAWSPDSRHVVSGSFDGTLRIWHGESGQEIRVMRQPEGILGVDWSRRGNCLASGANDHTVRLWDAHTGQELLLLAEHGNSVYDVAFSPDGARLAAALSDSTIAVYDVADLLAREEVAVISSREQDWLTRQAATVGRQARLNHPPWVPSNLPGADLAIGCLGVLRPEEPGNKICCAAIGRDGRTLFSGHPDGHIRCWDLTTGTLRWTSTTAHSDWVRDIKPSPDGLLLASASDDHSVHIWQAATGKEIRQYLGHEDWIRCVAWSPQGERLVSGSDDCTLHIWDVATGQQVQQCLGHQGWVRSVDWSPDGQQILSGSDDKTVRIWNSVTGQELFLAHQGKDNAIYNVPWSPQGDRFAANVDDHVIQIWDAATRQIIARCQGHTRYPYAVAWFPQGHRLASISSDNTIRIWEAATGEEVGRFGFPPTGDYPWRLAFSPDGGFLVSSHHHDTIRIWDTRAFLPQKKPLSMELAPLPVWLATMHRLGIHPPLSLLRDVMRMLEHRGELPLLARQPLVARILALRWLATSHLGLAALLLRGLQGGEWQPPTGLIPAQVKIQLEIALAGEEIPAKEVTGVMPRVLQGLAEMDERLITLLRLLGSQALAEEPGLGLRLLGVMEDLPPWFQPWQTLLDGRLEGVNEGPAMSATGGCVGGGIVERGPITAMLFTQFAHDWPVIAWKHQTGGLLYRARTGQEPPRLRPVVLVLDVSPPCFGPIETITRPAALLVARTLLHHHLPVILVTAGGMGQVHHLQQSADLLTIFTSRTLDPARPVHTLQLASNLAQALHHQTGLQPLLLLLTHTWWGELEEKIPTLPNLRGLFVQYPDTPGHPPWASHCTRWETITCQNLTTLAQPLIRLLQ